MRQGIRRQWRQQDQQAVTEHHPEMSCSNVYQVDAAGRKENQGMRGGLPLHLPTCLAKEEDEP